MKTQRDLSIRQMSRGEKETETEAARLIEYVEEALAAVAIRSTVEVDSLEGAADRIERAARDLSTALRELAEQRRLAENRNE
jgi:predicted ATP-grasp superfamily ATP-dependent carboligase